MLSVRMSYTGWLRRQVSRIEEVIHDHPVFDTSEPATAGQLAELREIVVIHTFLKQQYLRRRRAETVWEELDPQELVLVRKSR